MSTVYEIAQQAYTRLREYASEFWGVAVDSEVAGIFTSDENDGIIGACFQNEFMSSIVGFEFDENNDSWILVARDAFDKAEYKLGTNDLDSITDEMLHEGFQFLSDCGHYLF